MNIPKGEDAAPVDITLFEYLMIDDPEDDEDAEE